MPKGQIDGYNYDSDMSFGGAVEARLQRPQEPAPDERPMLGREQINAFEYATGQPFTGVPNARVVTGDELAAAEAPMQEKEDYAKLAANKQATKGQIEAFDKGAKAARDNAPRAKVVSPQEDGRLMSIFRTTMGAEFDPKSKMDKRRLEELRSFVASKPDMASMSPTKIALAFYNRAQ